MWKPSRGPGLRQRAIGRPRLKFGPAQGLQSLGERAEKEFALLWRANICEQLVHEPDDLVAHYVVGRVTWRFEVLRRRCHSAQFADVRRASSGTVRLLRSGCHVTHDHNVYARVSSIPGLPPALTVRAVVASAAEDGPGQTVGAA